MKGYRSRYADLEKLKAQALAVSTDDNETQAKFKAKMEAQFPFVADPGGKLVSLFGVKAPVVTMATRATFVIGTDRKILAVQTGGDAIDAGNVVEALKAAR